MNQLPEIITILAFFQLISIAAFFLLHYQGTLPRLISLYCFCLSSYTLATVPFFANNLLAFYILMRLATLAPFILWFITVTLFVDNGKVHPGAWIAIAIFELTRGIGIGIFYLYPQVITDVSYVVVRIIPQMIMLSFAVHTLYMVYQGYSTDLLEPRRRLRLFFLLVMGVLLIVIVGADFINQFSRFLVEPDQTLIPDVPDPLISLYILVMTFIFSQRIFQLSEDAKTLISTDGKASSKFKKSSNGAASVDPTLLEKINRSMEEGKLYTQTGLTISDLAEHLSIQEYRLRRIINQQLGFRNFNQFLNNYRIADACIRLRESATPISTIALDVGYASLSVFNKAFKERYGVTPTEFRNNEVTADLVAEA